VELILALGLLDPTSIERKVMALQGNGAPITNSSTSSSNQTNSDSYKGWTKEQLESLAAMRIHRQEVPDMYTGVTDEKEAVDIFRGYQASIESGFGGNSGGKTTTIDELKTMRVEFEPMDEAHIKQWVDKHPLGTLHMLNTTTTDIWEKKLILQELFSGGVTDMPKNLVEDWADNDPFFKDKNTLKTNQILEELEKRASAFKTRDYRGQMYVYPEYYLKQVNYVPTSTSTSTITGGAITKPSVPGRTRILQYPSFLGPDNVPNFASCSDGHLFTSWLTANADLFPDREYGKAALPTRRAALHRTYKGSFKKETQDAVQNVWCTDPHTFSEEEQTANWPAKDIAKRMDDVYVDFTPRLFISLDSSELAHWTQNLPPTVSARMHDKEGHFLESHARGVLHRVFVGEFEELRAEGPANSPANIQLLANWRNADTTKYGSVKEAVDGYIYVFGQNDLPWLAASPLHWPSREHRFPTGEKRKRGEDSDDDDVGKPKKPKTTPGGGGGKGPGST
jgi:hypothetical protein